MSLRLRVLVGWFGRARRLTRVLFLLAAALGEATPLLAQTLVISPHPDDDVLIASGVIRRMIQNGQTVRIVYLTNGDHRSITEGFTRQVEAVSAAQRLGVPEQNLIFLGYPDGHLKTVFSSYPAVTDAFPATNGQAFTYGRRGLGAVDYHTFRFGAPATYNRANIVADLKDILETYRPAHIFTVSEFDGHDDHQRTYQMLGLALDASLPVDYNPTIHRTAVWPVWPGPLDPTTYMAPAPVLLGGTSLTWAERESLDVPLDMQSTAFQLNPKYLAIGEHRTQNAINAFGAFIHKDEVFWVSQPRSTHRPPVVNAGLDQVVPEGASVQLNGADSLNRDTVPLTYTWRQILGPPVDLSDPTSPTPSFVAPTGLPQSVTLGFELSVADSRVTSVPDAVHITVRSALDIRYGGNIAPAASVTASSESSATGQTSIKAIDGVPDGYPGDFSREWRTAGQRSGAWIQLTWAQPVTVGSVHLFDRPNLSDFIHRGRLVFSDGSVVSVGPVDNWGRQSVYTFAPRSVTSVGLMIDEVSSTTRNVGLSEFRVFEVLNNRPPVANAGGSQTVNEGAVVRLDGSGSSDADLDQLTYSWRQTGGMAMTLSSTSGVDPTFSAPALLEDDQLLTFELVVSDGRQTSEAHSVQVLVIASPQTNIAQEALVTFSSQNTATQQLAIRAVDGVVDGYPGNFTHEWATRSEGVGAWVQLSWNAPRSVHRVVLHDRPNANDQIVEALIQFSDGSTVTVTELANNGGATTVVFAPRTVTSLRLTVLAVRSTTVNIGLAEMLVFESATTAPFNHPPVAVAGPPVTTQQGFTMTLDGFASADPEGMPLSYRWAQTAGTAVVLSGATTPRPTFTTPFGGTTEQVLTFSLVVNDGRLDSAPSLVTVTVTAPPVQPTNTASAATVTASTQSTQTGQGARAAVDGIVDGYPGNRRAEWATVGEGGGAWIQLTWSAPQPVERIVLHDRINLNDNILGAVVEFSDGTSIVTGPLASNGIGLVLSFPPRATTSVRVTITAVSSTTSNVGLAELMVFGQVGG